jgi:hypothetical protein
MSFTSVPSYFSSPSFGVDTSGAFAGVGSSLASSPLASSSSVKPTGMDPFSIGAAVLAPVIGGIFGQSAAEKQAAATERLVLKLKLLVSLVALVLTTSPLAMKAVLVAR